MAIKYRNSYDKMIVLDEWGGMWKEDVHYFKILTHYPGNPEENYETYI
jgi:hypothetical protein